MKRSSLFLALLLVAIACASAQQDTPLPTSDPEWQAEVPFPAFSGDDRPRVVVDGAHGNWHTIDGRFSSFADLLRADGYVVDEIRTEITEMTLEDHDVLVIANAILGGESAEWILPTPQAFSPEEIETIEAWVAGGGSLLLIADHMPFPGAVSDLAAAFGVVFYNGFAMQPLQGGGVMTFSRPDGTLADHPITRGRNPSEIVEHVRAFSGQAFRADRPIEPILLIPDDWVVLLPTVAWEFPETVSQVSARGLVQGAVLEHHKGRVAVFGEAAMFTTQRVEQDGVVYRIGMNHPQADQNDQFVLNLMHWLSDTASHDSSH